MNVRGLKFPIIESTIENESSGKCGKIKSPSILVEDKLSDRIL
jgi:hypothetical protein